MTEVQFEFKLNWYPQQFPVAHMLVELQGDPTAQLVPDWHTAVEREVICQNK